ncbi:segregation/condensation protein A [Clostridium tagluense]|uniref:segregation/condensation protein A n=1 Tax=Clostridium TaxID=1485 RepID=UPI0013E9153A|nr:MULTISPECIES: segregation/condensation protein A [Clostridium]MBU3126556.1 segregation/condensation protein A [Clostridium tagluense]MBW9156324.1 segregation/condensation protein A [Clostridium tagluense]MBZ9624449.1 segregation/condensation protein A [Clostridium sp. FP2]MCB2309924.1 segregation/condensation protein A [Clostridium tagluense]MCB2314546.1 segregation/condensation protein A [Clostridium tagluense]
MPLSIKVTNFEGPFDLLLHLIKKNEMNIYDINIYEITSQYLEYLKTMKEMDLEVTSEFIVIAATLIQIKSKRLLPKNKEENSKEEENDVEAELLNKLIEYRKYKVIADNLKMLEQGAGIMFSKKPEIIEEDSKNIKEIDFLKNVTMLDLYNLYNNLMQQYINKMNVNNIINKKILVDEYKIEDKMLELKEALDLFGKVYFSKLITGYSSKIEVIVTFLALLELIKIRSVRVIQESTFKDIYLERVN